MLASRGHCAAADPDDLFFWPRATRTAYPGTRPRSPWQQNEAYGQQHRLAEAEDRMHVLPMFSLSTERAHRRPLPQPAPGSGFWSWSSGARVVVTLWRLGWILRYFIFIFFFTIKNLF